MNDPSTAAWTTNRLARRGVPLAAVALVTALALTPSTPGRAADERPPAAGPGGLAVYVPPPQSATSGCRLQGADPARACTPGAVNPVATQRNIDATVCKPGWSRQQRERYLPLDGPRGSRALKAKVAAYYDPPGVPATSEGDHLISIELGGDPAGGPNFLGANFFDEPHDLTAPDGQPAGSLVKDGFENALHRMVCARQMTLADAQREIATDWYGAYVDDGRPTR